MEEDRVTNANITPEFGYRKVDPTHDIPDGMHHLLHATHLQYYIPIFKKFFAMTEHNANRITLNFANRVLKLGESKRSRSNNVFSAQILEEPTVGGAKPKGRGKPAGPTANLVEKDIFVKRSLFFESTTYLTDSYPIEKALPHSEEASAVNDGATARERAIEALQAVPTFGEPAGSCAASYHNPDNVAFVDGFFNYLSSVLLNEHGHPNALDCYGVFLGLHSELEVNVIEDINYLYESEAFNQNNHVLYEMGDSNYKYAEHLMSASRNNKRRIHVVESGEADPLFEVEDLEPKGRIEEPEANTGSSMVEVAVEAAEGGEGSDEFVYLDERVLREHEKESDGVHSNAIDLLSSSSRTSNTRTNETIPTTESDSESEVASATSFSSKSDSDPKQKRNFRRNSHRDSEEQSGKDDDEDDDDDDNDFFNLKLYNVPSCVILMEKCLNTVDSLIIDEDFEDDEFAAMLAQIVLTLASYQRVFKFTHNDLHSSNILFVKTDRQYLYYCLDHVYYKVPTYGRIYKIIDFDRAIYTFRGKLCMGSCYEKGDVASGQYNCGPCYDPDKKTIEPNFSFDLCRFACSIFDEIIDMEDEYPSVECPIKRNIIKWCLDDRGKNILYKKNSVERYRNFKLYKMITRSVHNHTPREAIKDDLFKQYVVFHKHLNRKTKITNIDKLPELWRANPETATATSQPTSNS